MEGSDKQTRTGVLLGTPEYMAPEQACEGEPIGVASDIWAWAILYTLLTGRPPFVDTDSLRVMQKIKHEDPVQPRSLQRTIGRDLETVCLKCLSKDPKRRYTSARDLADDLARIRAGNPILARRIGPVEKAGNGSSVDQQ